METVKVICYKCEIDDAKFYDRENGFTYVQCNKCSLIYLNPRPILKELTSAHKTGMHRGEKTLNVTSKHDKSKIQSYIKILHDFFPSNLRDLSQNTSWLDIGCGNGEFMEAIKKINGKIKIKGLEPNQFKIQSCIKRELDVSWVDIEAHQKKYDYISLLNVYSHLPNPKEYIKKIKKNLKPRGELFIQTGHSSHLSPSIHHKPYYAPDHLSFANQSIVEEILEKNGFEIKLTRIYRHEQFPTLKTPKRVALELVKIMLNKGGNINNLFPKHPNRNMYIQAKLLE